VCAPIPKSEESPIVIYHWASMSCAQSGGSVDSQLSNTHELAPGKFT